MVLPLEADSLPGGGGGGGRIVAFHINVVGRGKSVELREGKSKYEIRAFREQQRMKHIRIKGRTI